MTRTRTTCAVSLTATQPRDINVRSKQSQSCTHIISEKPCSAPILLSLSSEIRLPQPLKGLTDYIIYCKRSFVCVAYSSILMILPQRLHHSHQCFWCYKFTQSCILLRLPLGLRPPICVPYSSGPLGSCAVSVLNLPMRLNAFYDGLQCPPIPPAPRGGLQLSAMAS